MLKTMKSICVTCVLVSLQTFMFKIQYVMTHYTLHLYNRDTTLQTTTLFILCCVFQPGNTYLGMRLHGQKRWKTCTFFIIFKCFSLFQHSERMHKHAFAGQNTQQFYITKLS